MHIASLVSPTLNHRSFLLSFLLVCGSLSSYRLCVDLHGVEGSATAPNGGLSLIIFSVCRGSAVLCSMCLRSRRAMGTSSTIALCIRSVRVWELMIRCWS
jgi:hypothetical protein